MPAQPAPRRSGLVLQRAARLVRDAVVGAQAAGDLARPDQRADAGSWLKSRVRRVLAETTSRGDRELLVMHLAAIAASMAARVPADERDMLFGELLCIGQLEPEDEEMLRQLVIYAAVA